MKVRALFNKKREEEIREALKRGDASVLRRRKTTPETPAEAGGKKTLIPSIDNIADHELRERLRGFLICPDPEKCQGGILRWDDALVACALEGALSGIQAAITLGADVNIDVSHLGFTDEHGNLCSTPIQLAKAKGCMDIVEYLREHGAKE